MKCVFQSMILVSALAFTIAASAADKPTPPPSGPQTDGAFQKVILDSDKDNGDGTFKDTVVDPMELAIAKDGRVFYIERAGNVKTYEPTSKQTTIIGHIPVFTGLEDG